MPALMLLFSILHLKVLICSYFKTVNLNVKRQFQLPYILVYKSIRILRQQIASLKVLPVYKSTLQFENILE